MMMMVLKAKVMLGLHNVGIGLFTAHKGPKLEDLDIDYTSDPNDYFTKWVLCLGFRDM